jgi:outer membrane autotransporter protein
MTRAYSLRLDRVKRLSAVSTLALTLSLAYSSQAAAACVAGPAGTAIACAGSGNINTTNVNIPAAAASQNGILLSPVDAAADLTNNGTIFINQTGANAAAIGINVDDNSIFGTYSVVSNAAITVTSSGRAAVYGIAGNGDVASLEIENNAAITIGRGTFVPTTATATSLQALGGNLGVAAGIFAEEELEHLAVENNSTISASGTLSAGIYSRAAEFELENNGTIANTSGGIAIAAVSDSGILTEVEIENSGTITGDVMVVGGHALRWWALSNGLATSGGIDNRLNINSQFGDINSVITNSGTITGKFYYGNGSNTLVNEKDGTITGNINVDQRAMTITGRTCAYGSTAPGGSATCFAAGSLPGTAIIGNPVEEEASENSSSIITAGSGVSGTTATYTLSIWGEKEFTFENAGIYSGDVTVATAPATTINGFDVPDSTVTIVPHIYGGGNADEDEAVNPDAQTYIDGTLKVADGIVNGTGGTSSIARTTTIAPVIESLVKTGEWYTVSTGLYGSDVPEVDGSVLVSWEAVKNSGGALVIGSTVADSSVIDGLTRPGAATLDGLLGYDGGNDAVLALGGAIQNSNNAEEIRKASEQLAPDTSFGVQQSAWTLAALQGSAIDARIGSSGSSGGGGSSTTGFSQPSGLGMGNGDAQRSNLGGTQGSSYGPSREGAWGQAFGAHLDDDKDAINGAYKADIYGFVAGYDNVVSPGFRLGGAFGYGNTDIKEQGDRSGDTTDAESYTATAYAALKGAGWYMTGRTGFTWHDYDTLRKLSVPVDDTATGSHEGRQYTASAEVGAPTRMAGAVVTPLASLTYNNLDQDGYTERSANGMALDVASQQNDSLVSGLGLRALLPIASGTVFEGRAIWLHEFADTNQVVTASFIGADTSFTAGGADVGHDTANLGAALTIDTGAGYSFQANYDAFLREDFVAHAGSGRILVRF